MAGKESYAQVILPLAVEGPFTYRVPAGDAGRLVPGCRVLVSFGQKRLYTAVILSFADSAPGGIRPKPILEVLDEEPHVLERQLQLWDWMASYYMCTRGEVMRAALPAGLRPDSESRVRIRKDFEHRGELDSRELLLLEVIREEGEVALRDLNSALPDEKPLALLRGLVESGAVEINEFVRHAASRKTVTYATLAPAYRKVQSLHALLDELERAPRQKELLERYLELAGGAGPGAGQEDFMPVHKGLIMQQGGSPSAFAALVRKKVFRLEEREEMGGVTGVPGEAQNEPAQLSVAQGEALASIRRQFQDRQCVLLEGVTSSGKTELYIHLIREVIAEGDQVLYLLPEIALTVQLIERIKKVFGNSVGVYHSRYTDSERVHVYRNLLGLTDEEPYRVVIGARSAVFLPFSHLGLIIIDEEHETTFKQQDPAPRYHARDTAQVLALYHQARVLLGTATPSFETLYNARTGKFGHAVLPGRFGGVQKPELILANTREAARKKQLVSHFTPEMVQGISQALENGEQVILFQNRRGYAPYLICGDCSHVPRCTRCDVSLTYHRGSGRLECHYCGARETVPQACPDCGGGQLGMKGFGTEKIEDEVAIVFEGVQVGRLDTDTARTSGKFEKAVSDFATGKTDILIGTQMVAKGLDFDNVALVGILDADSMLHFPDFRAFERSYQLMAQVSGRAGRRSRRGKVVIQTMDPGHPVVRHLLADDYEGLYREQMEEREIFGYPPFRRMIRISFRHRIPSILDGCAAQAAEELKNIFGSRVYGPQYPHVRKVQHSYIKQIILKVERNASFEKARELLGGVLAGISSGKVYKSIRISVDVDPY